MLVLGVAYGHQPRLVGFVDSIEVKNPQISQAFYAELTGRPQTYTIRSEASLRLYVNILVPDIPGIETDYEAVVSRSTETGEEIVARLDGAAFDWKPFFEPFGGDRYLLGPEYDQDVPAGTYTVVVSSPDNHGKYALAVGKVEKFPLKEMARTIVTIPKLKRYFGKSPLTAFFNLSGGFLVLAAGAITGLAVLIF